MNHSAPEPDLDAFVYLAAPGALTPPIGTVALSRHCSTPRPRVGRIDENRVRPGGHTMQFCDRWTG